jgi:hypothetical protein
MEIARGEVIVLIDADGSMDPRELHRYVDAALSSDLVKGSRFMHEGGSEDISPLRRSGNSLLLRVLNLLYGARLTDLCYGYCAVRRSALPALALRSNGFEIESEMTARALRCGLRITEVPSFEAPRRYGESHLRTIRDGTRVLRTLLVERFRRRGVGELPAPFPPAPVPAGSAAAAAAAAASIASASIAPATASTATLHAAPQPPSIQP